MGSGENVEKKDGGKHGKRWVGNLRRPWSGYWRTNCNGGKNLQHEDERDKRDFQSSLLCLQIS